MQNYKEISSRTIRNAVVLLVIIVAAGTLGYLIIEPEYSLIDAFFMTVITISTVGFGEVHPLSDAGKLFTSGLIISSLGSLAFVGSNLFRYVFDGEFITYLRTRRVYKKIEKMKDHVIVCGFGRNGEQVCNELTDHNTPFVIIEKRDHVIERIRENPDLAYIRGDATDENVLEQARITDAKALIATTPNDADNVFVVLTARSMNPNLKIISRASGISSDVKLRRAGATNVIMPERIGGQRMAKLVLQPDVVEFVEYILLQRSDDVSLEELSCKGMARCFCKRTVGDLKQLNLADVSIVGIKRADGEYVINPPKSHKINIEDQLFVLGSPNEIKNFRKKLDKGVPQEVSYKLDTE